MLVIKLAFTRIGFYKSSLPPNYLHIIATFTHNTTLNINIDHESLDPERAPDTCDLDRNLRPSTCDPARKKKDPVFKPGLLIKVWRNPSNEIDLRTITSATLEVNDPGPGSTRTRSLDPGDLIFIFY